MPELPEVETIRRGLAPFMEGERLTFVQLNRMDLRFPFPAGFAAALTGQRIIRLGRRAKYILAEMDNGLTLAMHLGMTGRFTIVASAAEHTPGAFYYGRGPDPKHDHVVFGLSHGGSLRYNDVRRFGYMDVLRAGEMAVHPLFRGLGVEPLSEELTPGYLRARAEGKQQPLKGFLLDQRVIAGLGNIYVCEALFRARLSPLAPAGVLSGRGGKRKAERLCAAIRAVLQDAIQAGGSSLRDYRHADGAAGSFQERFDVYAREGEGCPAGCGSAIQRIVQQGRSTFFCPVCQL
jgi:formamidopyrimidine-DNA glycosylase